VTAPLHAPESHEETGGRDPHVDALTRTWTRKPGLIGWIGDVHHVAIGIRYIVTAFGFFFLAGLLAVAIRLQMFSPESRLLGPDTYAQVFTVHGSTMMFLFAVPIMEGMAQLLVPLMIGARNTAFPRLANYSYWTYLGGGLLLWVGLALNMGADRGWFDYVPLAGPQFSFGKRVDLWAQMITFTELAALAAAVNMVATILKLRAPGMTLSRMPLFVWAMLIMSIMVILAMPAIMVASSCLALDRLVGTHFFNQAEGGDPLLFQHLFWFFGHPEVYIIFIPALGMVSTLIIAFCRRRVVGYLALVLSLVATGFIGFGLWVHHMFATGLPQLGSSFFTASSQVIALPTGIQIFCWLATLFAARRPWFRVPLLWVLAFIVTFVIGGVSGMVIASVPLDLQVTDTAFIVAHIHYVLLGGSVMPLLGAVYYWFPKFTGRMPDEKLGRLSCLLFFIGVQATFFPLFLLGVRGQTRRIFTYPSETGWMTLNRIATLGAGILAVSLVLYLLNLIRALRQGPPAGSDPWRSPTLEWDTPSPPPPYGHRHPPVVDSREPLWAGDEHRAVVTGLRNDRRETLVTTTLDAEPDHRNELPGESIWPFLAALASSVTFIGVMFTPWAIPVGGVLAAGTLAGWFWPRRPYREELLREQP